MIMGAVSNNIEIDAIISFQKDLITYRLGTRRAFELAALLCWALLSGALGLLRMLCADALEALQGLLAFWLG